MKKKLTVGILAHVDAGKTTLSEALLYLSGKIRQLGRVDHKNTFLDTNAVERERGITIFSKQARFSWGDCDFILLDTPGHVDFSINSVGVYNGLGICSTPISTLALSQGSPAKGSKHAGGFTLPLPEGILWCTWGRLDTWRCQHRRSCH